MLPSPTLVATDAHDLECLLLRSPALERVLAELGDASRIRQFEAVHGQGREALIERGLPFGRLRWLAQRQGWQQPFDSLEPSQRFIDENTWQPDEPSLHAAAVQAGLARDAGSLTTALNRLPQADPWFVCRGHDLVMLLRLGLRRVLGSLKSGKGAVDIGALLRQGHDESDLYNGTLGRSIRCWESGNPPFRILPGATKS